MGKSAKYVMLKKGLFIEKALASLDDILIRMQGSAQFWSAFGAILVVPQKPIKALAGKYRRSNEISTLNI